MIPGDLESWHAEWMRIADRNWQRGLAEEKLGHIRTAMNCFLRAADYYRQAEFHLEPDDASAGCRPSRRWKPARTSSSPTSIRPAKWSRSPTSPASRSAAISFARRFPATRLPVLICMGGLDSIKDEMWFMQAHGCLQRGISVLMIDGPGQGGTLRRHGSPPAHDNEVPIGKCIDWLEKRADVDHQAHRRVRLQHGRLLRRARRLLRASAGRGDFARRDLVGARHVGHRRATTSASPCISAGCSAPRR